MEAPGVVALDAGSGPGPPEQEDVAVAPVVGHRAIGALLRVAVPAVGDDRRPVRRPGGELERLVQRGAVERPGGRAPAEQDPVAVSKIPGGHRSEERVGVRRGAADDPRADRAPGDRGAGSGMRDRGIRRGIIHRSGRPRRVDTVGRADRRASRARVQGESGSDQQQHQKHGGERVEKGRPHYRPPSWRPEGGRDRALNVR